jgi:exonuclease III/ribonuclease HI
MINEPEYDSEEDIDNLPEQISIQLSSINNTFTIATNNVRGLCETVKQQQFMTFIETNNIDVMGVSETKLNSRAAEFIYKNNESYLSWWNCDNSNQFGSGVGLIIKKNIAQYVQAVQGHNGRYIYADLYMKGRTKIRIIQVYIHANLEKKTEIIQLHRTLTSLIEDTVRKGFQLVIMGDFNADLNKFLQIQNQLRTMPWKFSLLKTLTDFNLTETYIQFHDQNVPTWYSSNKSACLDHIWISQHLLTDLLYADTLPTLIYGTDHKVVTAHFITSSIFSLPSISKDKKNNTNVTRRFIYSNMNDSMWENFTHDLEQLSLTSDSLRPDSRSSKSVRSLNRMWEQIVKHTMKAAKDYIPSHECNNSRHNDSTPRELLVANSQIRYVSKLLMQMSDKKRSIPAYQAVFSRKWNLDIKHKLLLLCSDINYSLHCFESLTPETQWQETKLDLRNLLKVLYTTLKLQERKYYSEQLKFYINKRCEDLLDNKANVLSSILERKKRRITLDRILIKTDSCDELITDPTMINFHTNQHFQNAAGGVNGNQTLSERWSRQYCPIQGINEHWYDFVMSPPNDEELRLAIAALPNNKATGPSGISNEMIKHFGVNMIRVLKKLITLCLIMNDVPQKWREANVYPIPKPTEWNCNLNNTRPITLLETIRKLMVKIINKRLSHILAKHHILKGNNHAGLPGGSTFAPLHILNGIIEDAAENNRELWILFQDMSKAYDRVNLYMLNLAMRRLKFPVTLSNLLINLFARRTNRIIGHNGLTEPYQVLIGIDQGEVISPLLWCIYYDPLLCEIAQQQNIGYEMTHSWTPDVTKNVQKSLSVKVSSQAYMDDTTWINHNQRQLEHSLEIADEFYILNNIKVNKGKSVLLTNANTSDPSNPLATKVTLNFGRERINIQPARTDQSVRFLGVWINLDLKMNFVKAQIKDEVTKNCLIMKRKYLTDEHLLYVHNHVIVPRISYRMQLTVISPSELDKCNAAFRSLLKNKSHMSSRAPNYIMKCNEIYRATTLIDHQLQSLVANLNKSLNNQQLLGTIMQIRQFQLQHRERLVTSPFIEWHLNLKECPKTSYIARALSILKQENMTFTIHNTNEILGGRIPLISLLALDGCRRKNFVNSLRKRNLMFLTQLTSADGTYLLTWKDLNSRPGFTRCTIPPFWFKDLEHLLLVSPNVSRRLKMAYFTGPNPVLKSFINSPDLQRRRLKEWIAFWDESNEQLYLGHIVSKSACDNTIIVEHWLPFSCNTQVTPDSAPPIISQCPGCLYNEHQYNALKYSKKRVHHYKCTRLLNSNLVITVPGTKSRNDNTYILKSSLFELKQQAKYMYDRQGCLSDPSTPTMSRSSSPTFVHESNLDPILKHVSTANIRLQLWEIKTSLTDATNIQFYTDGSLSDAGTTNMKMGIAWVVAEPSELYNEFSASCSLYPSSTRAEIFAILSALCVVPPNCHVQFMTDSQAVIQRMSELPTDQNNYNTDTSNYLLWATIRFIISSNNLTVSLAKVAAHTGVYLNEKADTLAKRGQHQECFTWDYDAMQSLPYTLKWKTQLIDISPRVFAKQLCQAKNFNSLLNSKRNSRVKTQTRNSDIDWQSTWSLVNFSNSPPNTTSFEASNMKAFKVKCMFAELSTMDRMKVRRPDLYNNPEWHCILCNQEENFNHLWNCKKRKITIERYANELKYDIIKESTSVSLNSGKPVGKIKETDIDLLPCWTFNESHFSLLDLIRGYVPASLLEILVSWGLTLTQARSIAIQSIHKLQCKLKGIWLERCELVVKKEKSKNITKKVKRSGKKNIINVDNLVFPVINYDLDDNIDNRSECTIGENSHNIWLKLGMLFGNSWQDF